MPMYRAFEPRYPFPFFWVTYYILSLRIAKCDPPEAKTLGRREGESFVPHMPKRPVHRDLTQKG